MTDSRRIVGDCRDVLRQLIDEGVKVQMCVTSPPYWRLRDYGTGTWEGGDGSECEHFEEKGTTRGGFNSTITGGQDVTAHVGQYRHTCAKCGARRVDKQIGLEATIEVYVATMVEVFRLVWEVLADDGTCWINLGDSYATQGGRGEARMVELGSPTPGAKTVAAARGEAPGTKISPGLKPKDLCGMPWRVALALQADGWWLRSDIIWSKPNPMPESCTDRPTKSHEYLFLLAKRANYFYDAEAVREANSPTSCGNRRTFRTPEYTNGNSFHNSRKVEYDIKGNSGELSGRNRRTVWTIATEPYSQAHFATFPKALVTPCILAGTSQRGHCPECGARWVRVVERQSFGKAHSDTKFDDTMQAGPLSRSRQAYRAQGLEGPPPAVTTGWRPTCQCDVKPVPDVVLDAFGGSGTVGAVAEQLGRKWILIDLSEEYSEMQKRRTAQTGMAL